MNNFPINDIYSLSYTQFRLHSYARLLIKIYIVRLKAKLVNEQSNWNDHKFILDEILHMTLIQKKYHFIHERE